MMPNRPDESKSDKKPPLLPVDQALAAILALLPQTNTITKPLDKALGFTLADDLVAVLTLPPQAVSAMDGYAVRAADVTSFPCKLTRIAESAAGHPWTGKIGAGQAVRVFTGAAIPDGADTIVIQEDVDPVAEQDNVEITVRSAEIAGRYIRPAGLDITAGQVILPAGTLLSARAIGLAIAAGLTQASVRLRPRVGVLSTGDELVPPGELPGPGQIISSNASFLANFVSACGAEAVDLGIARDVPGAMLDAVRRASNLDLVVTTGGASVGTHDHIVSDLASSKTRSISGKSPCAQENRLFRAMLMAFRLLVCPAIRYPPRSVLWCFYGQPLPIWLGVRHRYCSFLCRLLLILARMISDRIIFAHKSPQKMACRSLCPHHAKTAR